MDYKPRILSGMHIQVDTRWISDEFVSGEFMTLECHWNAKKRYIYSMKF